MVKEVAVAVAVDKYWMSPVHWSNSWPAGAVLAVMFTVAPSSY